MPWRRVIEPEAHSAHKRPFHAAAEQAQVDPLPDIQAGRLIAGKFRLTRQLGQGGMGSVWAALHETLGREVAVKFLQPQAANTQVLADRFVSEAQMVASIKHRFVVDVFDYGITEDGLHYMVLELLHGRSLADRMDHGPVMPVRTAVKLMADCLRGLHVVHDAGIIHRDLKPDNIFVIDDTDGAFPKLIDFGISRRTDPPNLKLAPKESRKSRLTQPGVVLGTPYYMSPEQLRGKQSVDARSDIYSFGIMLYELLAGHLPYRQDNIGDLMVAITVTGAPPLAVLRPELGTRLSDVVARAMSPVPERRYADARELRKALLELLPELPINVNCVVQNSLDTHPGNAGSAGGAGGQGNNGKSGRTEELGPHVRSVPAALTVARGPSIVPVPEPEVASGSHVRASIALAAAVAVALLSWFALSLPTSHTARAGLDRPVRSHLSVSRMALAPVEVTDVSQHATSAPLVLDDTPAQSAAGPRGPDEPQLPPAPLLPLASDDQHADLAAPAALEEKTQPRKSGAAPRRTRARDRDLNLKARSTSSDRPPRLYKKLDF